LVQGHNLYEILDQILKCLFCVENNDSGIVLSPENIEWSIALSPEKY